jgi:lactoylglutathione lyase
MIRVKDAEKSLKFYQEALGMSLQRKSENPNAKFNLYFLGYGEKGGGTGNGTAHSEGLLELTWNYGTEKDESFSYHTGNAEPQGFGHICEISKIFFLAGSTGRMDANLLLQASLWIR